MTIITLPKVVQESTDVSAFLKKKKKKKRKEKKKGKKKSRMYYLEAFSFYLTLVYGVWCWLFFYPLMNRVQYLI